MAEWTNKLPDAPGRYFFRDKKYKHYGICLIAWSAGTVVGEWVQQPELRVQSMCLFGTFGVRDPFTGETTEQPNWSFSGSQRDKADLLFWSEALATPPDFPSLPGRPPDVSEKRIQEEAKLSSKAKRKQQALAREASRARNKQIASAVRDGTTLHECTECSRLLTSDELVEGTLRSCPHCCTEWTTGEGDERNCPECNRPFTKVDDRKRTCPDCLEDGELPEMTVLVLKGAMAEK